MLTTLCPLCSQSLKASDELIWKAIKCTCGHSFVLQAPMEKSPQSELRRPGVKANPFARRLWPRVRL